MAITSLGGRLRVRNVHLRIAASALVGGCAATLWRARSEASLIAIVAGVVLLAFGAGVSTLWSP
jgi:hypothetical protein